MKAEQEFADSIFAWHRIKNASSNQVADAASETWRDINLALSPIIGQQGVVALFKRSLHLQQITYPLLKTVHGSKILPSEFPAALHSILTQQTNTNAFLINSALLNTFYELLSNLIGAPLTQQLLHSVFDTPSSGDPTQDILS